MRDNTSLMVLAAVATVLLLYWGGPFFVPLFISLLISYALSPVVNALTLLVRWRALAAGVVVSTLVALTAAAAWAWSDDAEALLREMPAAAKTLSKSLQRIVQRPAGPITDMKKAAAELQSITQTGKAAPAAPAASDMSVSQVLWTGWKGVMSAGIQAMVVLFLVFFMLSSGDLFKKKLLAIGSERNQRRFTLQVIEEIDAQIRRYLVALLASNALVGLGTWFAFWLLGMKYAGLWGVIAAVLHTAPYFGPATIAAGSLVVAFVQFEDWPKALLISGSSILVATFVGSLFTTWLASRQTRMNATASFIGLLFFGWVWGFWGILLAIPLLAIVKTICEHNEDWKPVAELLGR